jgi:Trypsin-co-occurring domain 1
MPSEIVRAQMPDGGVVWARITQDRSVRDTGVSDAAFLLTVDGFPEAIASVAQSIRLGVAKARPREVKVEFGIELAAKTGKIVSVLAEAGATAAIKVELTWGKEQSSDKAEEDLLKSEKKSVFESDS